MVRKAVMSRRKPARPVLGRRTINLPRRPVQAPFSDGVQVGNTVYLAGRIGIDPKTGEPPSRINEEIRLMLDGRCDPIPRAPRVPVAGRAAAGWP